MSHPGYGAPSDAGERWNVNMPAVIGVVFVFLVGVIVWVIASGGSDGTADDPVPGGSTTAAAADSVVTQTTGDTPEPDPGSSSTTSAATTDTTPDTTTDTTPTTTPTPTPTTEPPPVTTAPGAGDGAIPGDLAIRGEPMQRPSCDGAFITVLASAVGGQATASGVGNVLDTYPGSSYLRTDQTCPSLTPDIDGAPIYVVYLGPFALDTEACTARSDGPEGAYVRRLSNDLGPDHSVRCP